MDNGHSDEGAEVTTAAVDAVELAGWQIYRDKATELDELCLPRQEQLPTATSPSSSHASISPINMQIQEWVQKLCVWQKKALDILHTLYAEDDIAQAMQGRKYISIINARIENYDTSVRELEACVAQARQGFNNADDLPGSINVVLAGQRVIHKVHAELRAQVEIGMEWDEIVQILDGIAAELDNCQKLVFELEEKRHSDPPGVSEKSSSKASSEPTPIELEKLTRVLESNMTSMSPAGAHTISHMIRDENLDVRRQLNVSVLKLGARMQPLRAALNFIRPRLSVFGGRVLELFPSCLPPLDTRRKMLEIKYRELKEDEARVIKEIDEDQWISVFRLVSAQADRMMESIERSLNKLSVVDGEPDEDELETYDSKCVYYGPAIKRVLDVVQKSYNSRLTLNGEITRNYEITMEYWARLSRRMDEFDDKCGDTFSSTWQKASSSTDPASTSGTYRHSDFIRRPPAQRRSISLNSNAVPPSLLRNPSNYGLHQNGKSPSPPRSISPSKRKPIVTSERRTVSVPGVILPPPNRRTSLIPLAGHHHHRQSPTQSSGGSNSSTLGSPISLSTAQFSPPPHHSNGRRNSNNLVSPSHLPTHLARPQSVLPISPSLLARVSSPTRRGSTNPPKSPVKLSPVKTSNNTELPPPPPSSESRRSTLGRGSLLPRPSLTNLKSGIPNF